MEYIHNEEVAGSIHAAEKVVCIIMDLLGPVQSIIDLGGGTGAWCQAFKAAGAEQVLCVDHPSVQSAGLLIDKGEFLGVDLENEDLKPVPVDLAVSVEFAEHLPVERAEWIVDFLTRSARRVLFSAATPRQGGIRHLNEQWPDYWKRLFHRRGFAQLDIIRPRVIHDPDVPFWYRQNLFLYAAEPETLASYPTLVPSEFTVLHETILSRLNQPTLKATLCRLAPALYEAVAFRARRCRFLAP